MRLLWSKWLYGLGTAIIGGGAGAVVSGVSTMLVSPATFNVTSWPGVMRVFSLMAINFILTGAFSMFFYLKQSPLPPESDTTFIQKTTNPNP